MIAGVSVVCALAPWVFTQATALRALAAAAALTAVLGAVVMRRWDSQAGKQVADLTRARVSDDWRHEERVAELETDLEESRELRVKLEQRLRAKRAELAGLRNEHAALLRRYATAETERATALEGRRLLEIEATVPARALPPAPVPPTGEETGAVAAPAGTETEADTWAEDAEYDEDAEYGDDEEFAEDAGDPEDEDAEDTATAEGVDTAEDRAEDTETSAGGPSAASTVFSPEGSKLFLRAKAALTRFDGEAVTDPASEPSRSSEPAEPTRSAGRVADGGATKVEAAQEDEAQGKPEAVDGHQRAAAEPLADTQDQPTARNAATGAATPADAAARVRTVTATRTAAQEATAPTRARAADVAETPAPADAATRVRAAAPAPTATRAETAAPARNETPVRNGAPARTAASADTVAPARTAPRAEPAASTVVAVQAKPLAQAAMAAPAAPGTASEAVAQARAATPPETTAVAATPAPGETAAPVRSGAPVQRPSGHFTVPTAVAVVPATAPVRRPTAEGGFDFFGMAKSAESAALEAVQNEDLADVVGQEALALHKAEAEAEFKPVDPQARGVGQVIDLTAHDETEQIDLQGLRSAAS